MIYSFVELPRSLLLFSGWDRKLIPEIQQWLIDNQIEYEIANVNSITFRVAFKSSEDATLFSLRWSGNDFK